MNTKNKSGKKTATAVKTKRMPQKGVQAKMQLLGFLRGKDTFLELMTGMQSVDQELAASRDCLRACESGSPEEDECLLHIRHLEDRRFQLLSELHGNRVNDYHLLSRL